MEFALLAAMQQDDMLGVRLSNLTDEGVDHVQAKTGTRLVIAWSDDLRAAVERAMQLQETDRAQRSAFLFAKRNGSRYTQSGFQTGSVSSDGGAQPAMSASRGTICVRRR